MSRFSHSIRLVSLLLIGGVLMALAMSAGAQEGDPNAPLPDADPHMQDLSWFIGEWNVHSRMLTDAENDIWVEEDLRTVHTYEMNGHLVFEHFYGPLGGAPFEAWSLRRFNPGTGHWEQRWVDTSPSGFANWRGVWDAEARTFTGYAERYVDAEFNVTGETAIREIFDNITEDSFNWRYEQTSDGGETWTLGWTLDYVRAES